MEDLKFLRDNWEGPLIFKGVQSVSDATNALDHEVDGIIVSNHGKKETIVSAEQTSTCPSTWVTVKLIELSYTRLTTMKSPVIKDAQHSGKLTVLFDSGIRSGRDVFKAIALGAHAVLFGRPWLYGGIVTGQAGIEQVLEPTIADLDTTLGLAGWWSLAELHGRVEEVLQKVDF